MSDFETKEKLVENMSDFFQNQEQQIKEMSHQVITTSRFVAMEDKDDEKLRKLVREKKDHVNLVPTGNCFDDSLRLFATFASEREDQKIPMDDIFLCHGLRTPMCQGAHGWVETKEGCFEIMRINDMKVVSNLPNLKYYALHQVMHFTRYSVQDMERILLFFEAFGDEEVLTPFLQDYWPTKENFPSLYRDFRELFLQRGNSYKCLGDPGDIDRTIELEPIRLK